MKLLKNFTVSYAQNREDLFIDAFFPDIKKGYYVDVGANHPYYHSVTKIFYDKGWRGINIEPNPMLHKQLEDERPEDINLLNGVGDKVGELDLRVYHSADGLEGISTFSKEMKREHSSSQNRDSMNYDDIKVDVTTLSKMFSSHKVGHIHFMKIDVEGFEYEVIEGNDWSTYRPELVCIEANHIVRDWRPLLQKARYTLVFNDGLNEYYLAEESKDRVKHFDYAKIILLGKPVISIEVAHQLIESNNQVNANKNEIRRLHKEVTAQKVAIGELKSLLEEITPLRRHVKRQIIVNFNRLRSKFL